jgi:hypothetical protein
MRRNSAGMRIVCERPVFLLGCDEGFSGAVSQTDPWIATMVLFTFYEAGLVRR